MNCLMDLRDKITPLGIVTHSYGWILHVGKDRWTMCDSHLYLNGKEFAEKDLPTYLKGLKANPPVLYKRKPKKITANRSN